MDTYRWQNYLSSLQSATFVSQYAGNGGWSDLGEMCAPVRDAVRLKNISIVLCFQVYRLKHLKLHATHMKNVINHH